VPTAPMPDRPDLDRFRRQARELLRAARAGDPAALARLQRQHPGGVPDDPAALKLSAAQFVLAREYGFASWVRLRRYLDVVAEHGWDSALSAVPATDPAAEFCRLACLSYTREDGPDRWARARHLLAEHPRLTGASIWAAAAAASPDDVRRLLAGRPERAVERGGPLRWRPLSYLLYSRVDPFVAADAVLEVARQLLAAGADPNEGYLFDGLSSAFTLLTGAFGAGELGPQRQPAHPHGLALARLLLEAGADPNDAQALYNRMFSANNEHLELLFEFGLGRGDGGPWKERAGELLDPPAELLRTQLRWAVEHNQPDRVRLLVEHGIDFRSPYLAEGLACRPGDGRTPVELAVLNGDTGIADYLVSRGATPPEPDPVSELIAAVFRADMSTVERIRAEHPDAVAEARRRRPGLIVWAAARGPSGAVELLAELGFDVNALGRADAPVEEPWETALHHSAGAGDADLTRRLLALGADPTIHDARFDATPLDWARHLGQATTIDLLGPLAGSA
jgi:ankyrin repeat protein